MEVKLSKIIFSRPRTIFYQLSTRERTFDFKTPITELRGRSSKHIEPKESKEYSPFSRFTVMKMPNSSRTLHPELNVEPSLKETKSCYFTNTSNKDHIKSILSTYTENAVRPKTRRVFPQKYSNTKIFL